MSCPIHPLCSILCFDIFGEISLHHNKSDSGDQLFIQRGGEVNGEDTTRYRNYYDGLRVSKTDSFLEEVTAVGQRFISNISTVTNSIV